MATGVSVHDEAIAKYGEFKKSSSSKRFIIFKIHDGKIVVDGEMSEDTNYQSFVDLLPADDCRYAVYKKDYTTNDGRNQTKLVFISWYDLLVYFLFFFIFCSRAPDSSPVKKKMIYAGSKDALTRGLEGIMVKVAGTDYSEVSESVLNDACKRLG
jgi:cofilin